MNKPKLFLIDAYALIFRGYYAFIKNPRINSKGFDTSAIMGFLNSIFDILNRENPDYFSVVFDKGGSKDRREIFQEYKANRHATPEPILESVPIIYDILKNLGINTIDKEGYEADDIIGTIAMRAEKEGFQIFMVTPDKDFAQLVTEDIFLYKPARFGNGIEIWGVDEVNNKFEIDHPTKVIDYLGMMGDSVDNIPGLPGVGEKTAKKFLKEYGSLEGLIENIENLKGKLKEKIEENKELGFLSKKLATIITNVPVEFELEDLKLKTPNNSEITKIFIELEFKRLTETYKKIFVNDNQEIKEIDKNIDLFTNIEEALISSNKFLIQDVSSETSFRLLYEKLHNEETYSIDVNKENYLTFCWTENSIYSINLDQINSDEFIKIIEPLFSANSKIYVFDIKKVLRFLKKYNLSHNPKKFFDLKIANYLIDSNRRDDFESFLKIYGFNLGSEERVFYINKLSTIVNKEIVENRIESLFKDVEMPLSIILTEMENEGVNIDTKLLDDIYNQFDNSLKKLQSEIFSLSGLEFNLASPKQLGEILFDKLKIESKAKKTKTGQYSTSEETLSKLSEKHIIVEKILKWRSLQKLITTYVTALPKQINSDTKRIHTIFNQTLTSTGRLSSLNPNLQNIPIRTKNGKLIRKAFTPRNDKHILVSADYSQIELRVIASMSNDKSMIDAFNNDEDIHTATAANVFGIKLKDVTTEQRSHAKVVNFGIIYGVSAFGLSNQTKLNRSESKEIIENYYKSYPKLKDFTQDQIEFARKNGYVKTILGRKRFLNDINSRNAILRSSAERNAINTPVQGSAADIIKIAMIKINNEFQNQSIKSKLILQVHDELIFDCLKDELNIVKEIITSNMQSAYKLKVPLKVDIGQGNNWLEAH
ncbi:MAG: DNA polymerase I [Cryomorphaceae bacterium MED-G14]|nr:MAG: DNA polymerase I [Cryomorphaceae bacterium MED-G14]